MPWTNHGITSFLIRSLPANVLAKQNLIIPIWWGAESDKPWWSMDSCGSFTSKSSYLSALSAPSSDQHKWRRIWKFSDPLRFTIFHWQLRWRSWRLGSYLLLMGFWWILHVLFVQVAMRQIFMLFAILGLPKLCRPEIHLFFLFGARYCSMVWLEPET